MKADASTAAIVSPPGGKSPALNRTTDLIRRLGRRLARQEGIALVMVIGVSLVLGITGTTAMIYSTENVRAASTSRADERSFSLAEAGLNYAYATLYNASDPLMPGAVPTRSEQVENGTITWWGTLDTTTNTWTLTGRGSVPSPSGRHRRDPHRSRSREHSAHLRRHGEQRDLELRLCRFDDDVHDPRELGQRERPLLRQGQPLPPEHPQISGVNTVLHVGGTLTMNNSSHVATSQAPLAEVHVGGGCRVGNGAFHSPCGIADASFRRPLRMQYAQLREASGRSPLLVLELKAGTQAGCTTQTGTPPAFDTDGTMNRSLPSAVNLTPALAYDCQVKDAQGNLLGRLAWTPGSPGTLTIAGTIFFDGDIAMTNSVNAVYVGRATIYARARSVSTTHR